MSYMLGRQYVWVDATHVHIWSAEGYDGWDESSWTRSFETPNDRRSAAFGRPSGVSVRQKVADEYVVMRMAELVATGELSAAMDRALANHGENSGCQALAEHAAFLRAALGQLPPKPDSASAQDQ
ncbi:MAG TPA: hypothetical protein VJ808_01075 [Gemmatimonadales bacterium]|nr:hypothetical protein [Gemmatimonadales bacterium]